MRNMKFNMLYRILLVFIVCVLLLTGCNQTSGDGGIEDDKNIADANAGSENTGEDNVEKIPVEYGFDYSYSEEGDSCEIQAPIPVFCAYKSDRSEFDIENVTLTFCYGYDLGIYSPEFLINHGTSYSFFELYFFEDGKEFLIKRVEENLISRKYECKRYYSEDDHKLEKVVFNHSEDIRIPKEFFESESGLLSFRIYGREEYIHKEQWLATAKIYYKVVGDKVMISSKAFS